MLNLVTRSLYHLLMFFRVGVVTLVLFHVVGVDKNGFSDHSILCWCIDGYNKNKNKSGRSKGWETCIQIPLKELKSDQNM